MDKDPPSSPGSPGWAFVVAAITLVLVHLLLVRFYFGDALLAEIPYNRGDFSTHAAQVRRVLEALEVSGKPWAYDVQLLAGAPNGVLFDADNKGWELWTWAWVRLGVGEGKAFNAFVLAIHLVMPAVVYASARLFRLDRHAALTATGLALLLWGFDSFTRWMWFIGTVSYVFVAFFALLPMALFHRWIEDRERKYAIACALTLALAHLVHPYVFFILVGPMLAEYIRAGLVDKTLSRAEHAITWAIAGLTLAVNFWWLRTAAQFFHYILDSSHFEQSGLRFALFDAFGLLLDSSTQGWIGARTGVRLLCLIAAILALRAWRSTGDRRRLPFLVVIVTMAAFAYLGGHTPVAQLQPYRHALPLGFALLIPAGAWLHETLAARPWRGLAGGPRALALILALFAAQHLIRDILYFFAPVLPATQTLDDGTEIPLDMLGHAHTPGYRYEGQHEWEAMVAWVRARDDGHSRWLVQDQVLGEYLMARTPAPILGGFLVRNIEHSDANWWRTQGPQPPYDAQAMAAYLDRYAIRWVIVTSPKRSGWWDAQTQLFSRAGLVDGMLVYHVKGPKRLLDGRGEVEATINRIAVRASRPDQDLVLRFHWMETLVCEPDCVIEREPIPDDRVGFIRVPAPHPAEFAIVNRY